LSEGNGAVKKGKRGWLNERPGHSGRSQKGKMGVEGWFNGCPLKEKT